jgi:hypothetical protein
MHSWPTTLAHVCLWPLASFLFLGKRLAAATSRRITWRGITYELKSPTETVILARESPMSKTTSICLSIFRTCLRLVSAGGSAKKLTREMTSE